MIAGKMTRELTSPCMDTREGLCLKLTDKSFSKGLVRTTRVIVRRQDYSGDTFTDKTDQHFANELNIARSTGQSAQKPRNDGPEKVFRKTKNEVHFH